MSLKNESENLGMALGSNQSGLAPRLPVPDQTGFAISDLLAILLRHSTVFLLVFLGISALGTTYILGSHKKYSSKMMILVQNGRTDSTVSASRTEAAAQLQTVTEEDLYNQVMLMQSADVMDEVVDPGWSSVPAEDHPKDVLRKHEAEVAALQKSLLVTPIRKAFLFSVEATTLDPYKATRELRLVLNAFLNQKRKISHPNGAAAMFAQQADLYRQQWHDAMVELSNFQQNNRLVTVKDQEELIQKQVLQIDTQLQEADVSLAEVSRKIESDKNQIATLPQRQMTHQTEMPAVGSMETMRTKLSELSLDRTALLSKYKPDDRLVQQVDEKIAGVRASLAESEKVFSSEKSTDVNPTWQFANQDLNEATIRQAGLIGRKKALEAQLASLQQSLGTTAGATQQFSLLQNKVAELEANYQLYAQKRDEAKMTTVMDENQLLNVAVLQNPTFSPNPVRPRPLTDGILTFITATLFALFAVFLAHNASETIATERDLQTVSMLPTLASVPMLKQATLQKELA